MSAIGAAMTAVMTLYPRIYFACHTRHVRDPQTQRMLSRHQASTASSARDTPCG
jgi:hypothetical protein